MKRVQSPSSINTYFQCPRKYYYIYNMKLKTSPSIHLVRGLVAHKVLENFFTIQPEAIETGYQNNSRGQPNQCFLCSSFFPSEHSTSSQESSDWYDAGPPFICNILDLLSVIPKHERQVDREPINDNEVRTSKNSIFTGIYGSYIANHCGFLYLFHNPHVGEQHI